MSLIVLDASVFVAWIAPTQATPAASRLLAERKQHRFIVPEVFPVEARNALLSAERRDKWRIAETESAIELLGQLGIVVYPPLHGIDLDEAFRLARAERLSMYRIVPDAYDRERRHARVPRPRPAGGGATTWPRHLRCSR